MGGGQILDQGRLRIRRASLRGPLKGSKRKCHGKGSHENVTGAVQLCNAGMAVTGAFNAGHLLRRLLRLFTNNRQGLPLLAARSSQRLIGVPFADLSGRLANTRGERAVRRSSDLLRADNGFIGEENPLHQQRLPRNNAEQEPAP